MPRQENNNNNNFEPFPFPFWDFANYFNNVPGQGVDNHNPPPPPPPPSYPGGPGPRPPVPPTGPWGHWGGGPGASWAGFMNPEEWGASPWDEYHDHHRHGRHGRRGRHARHAHRGNNNNEEGEQVNEKEGEKTSGEKGLNEKSDSPDTMAVDSDPEEVVLSGNEDSPNEEENCKECHDATDGENRRRGGFCRRGRGGPRGGGFHGRRGGPHSHPFFGSHHRHHHHHPHRGGEDSSKFNFAEMMRNLTGHPLFQTIREQILTSTNPHYGINRPAGSGTRSGPDVTGPSGDESFTPPVDVFNTSTCYVLHIAIPGANKEDIGVNWDPERHMLQVTGVVHRPGDEEFINTLVAGERRIGLFDREIRLPPVGVEGTERDEVDGQGISAKMENGLLVVSVPKVEKEWTQVTKVDIE